MKFYGIKRLYTRQPTASRERPKELLKMMRYSLRSVAIFLFLAIGIAPHLYAESVSPAEKQKIEALIKYVGQMEEAKFVRNGSAYNAKTAATFLRRKWGANDSEIRTARDFIDKIATASGTSGKPYVIRFKNGSETKSRDFLLAALNRIENPGPAQVNNASKSSYPAAP
jgi:hypothetical protein